MAKTFNENGLAPAGAHIESGSGTSVLACCGKEGVCVSVGVLGHVDSGKTSICRALSQVISTCGLDKHPQSKERGITLDLGFSAFSLLLPANTHCCSIPNTASDIAAAPNASTGIPEASAEGAADAVTTEIEARETVLKEVDGEDGRQLEVQVCLVDCPGHASLVRTVIGGAHIIDLALLVVDATKGVQAQTAECIVICQVIRKPLLVVLNKIDLISEASREQKVALLTRKMQRLLESLGFGSVVPVVGMSASPSTPDGEVRGIDKLKEALAGLLLAPLHGTAQKPLSMNQRGTTVDQKGGRCLLLEALDRQRCLRCRCCVLGGFAWRQVAPLLFCSDHAFAVRGKGTVVTGTMLRGRVGIGDTVTLLSSATAGVVALAAKVKGIQRFRKDAAEARAGQRAAINLSGVDSSHMERGLLTAPGEVPPVFKACIASVRLIKIFQLPVESGNKFHCTVGHFTNIATVHFFRRLNSGQEPTHGHSCPQLLSGLAETFNSSLMYEEEKCLTHQTPEALALFSFERPVLAPMGSVLLGSRLDVEASLSMCRLAFEGCILRSVLLPHPKGNMSSSSAALPSDKSAATSKAKPQAGDAPKKNTTAQSAIASNAAVVPLPLAALCVVRRKWRVGVVERFVPDGTMRCSCSSETVCVGAAGPSGAPFSGTICGFQSSSLVVRGLFKDAQHARRFAGFRVALLQTTKEEAERELEGKDGGALSNACLSVCFPSLATLRSSTTGHNSVDAAVVAEAGSDYSTENNEPAVKALSNPEGEELRHAVWVRPALVATTFGLKGKCHVKLLSPLACAEAAGIGGFGTARFCVALMYCKSCFNKDQPLVQP